MTSTRLRDGRGQPIPKRLAAPFRTRDMLLRFLDQHQTWETDLRKRAENPGGEALDLNAIAHHCYMIHHLISQGIPHESCTPECDPKGWLSIAEANAKGRYVLPDEL